MTPPDTNMEEDKRWHRGPLALIVALMVIVLVGFVYWVGEEVIKAPGPDETTIQTQPSDIRTGDVDVPDQAPTETVEPSDPSVEVNP